MVYRIVYFIIAYEINYSLDCIVDDIPGTGVSVRSGEVVLPYGRDQTGSVNSSGGYLSFGLSISSSPGYLG
jgi:hypothetical protein